MVASSAAWVERHRATIEHAIGKAIKTSHMSWRPSVEILKEEGLQLDAPSSETALDELDDFEVTPGLMSLSPTLILLHNIQCCRRGCSYCLIV